MTLFTQEFYDRTSVHPRIESDVFQRFDIKRGLRNADGTGVLAGATQISNVHGYIVVDDEVQPDEGRLTIRGYNLDDIVNSTQEEGRFGFEEIAYLLLFGQLPTKQELDEFNAVIDEQRELPDGFVNSLVLTAPSENTMNMMARSILNLYAYDPNPDEITWEHEVDTSVSLLARLPRIAPLSYYAHRNSTMGEEMIWHCAQPGLSAAETILYMLRENKTWTQEEAQMLDIMLMIHAEHGGGNNSTFTCRTLSSSGTDPYSAYAGAIGSLKGPKHGGANIRVLNMTQDIMDNVSDWSNEDQVVDYLKKIVRKEAYDRSGLVYGMGHAVYTKSDARTRICKKYAEQLAADKGGAFEQRYHLLEMIEKHTPEILAEKRGEHQDICANIDLYSGLIYEMLDIPGDLFTPLFAMSRLAGWTAHRFEEIYVSNRIIRPGYKSIFRLRPYTPLSER